MFHYLNCFTHLQMPKIGECFDEAACKPKMKCLTICVVQGSPTFLNLRATFWEPINAKGYEMIHCMTESSSLLFMLHLVVTNIGKSTTNCNGIWLRDLLSQTAPSEDDDIMIVDSDEEEGGVSSSVAAATVATKRKHSDTGTGETSTKRPRTDQSSAAAEDEDIIALD